MAAVGEPFPFDFHNPVTPCAIPYTFSCDLIMHDEDKIVIVALLKLCQYSVCGAL